MKNYGNLMYGVSDRILKVIAAVALAVATLSVNQCCMWFLGQDEIPERAKKLRRF
ncbi:cyclic lactone autoinducer peptide [Lachnospiraceae bacterium A4]|jgi:cyclic lactone autoinducer peptide|nr:cyclic lactone autoinducer peptide [Lachnospiraceae bacterium A4]